MQTEKHAKKFNTFMVQTDPMIDEIAISDCPVPLLLPQLNTLIESPLPEPINELIAAIELPQP